MDDTEFHAVTLPQTGIQSQSLPLYPIQTEKTETFAIAALVCGILGFMPILGLLIGIMGVAFGVVAFSRIRARNGERGKFMAIAGIVLGGISFTALSIFYSGLDLNGVFAGYRTRIAISELSMNTGAIESYKREKGTYPASLEEVRAAGFSIALVDPFLRPYLYEIKTGGAYLLRSAGPDRVFDTEDDIIM